GNVVFDASSKDRGALEQAIEKKLRQGLGYEVHTFVRTPAEILRIAEYEPFGQPAAAGAGALVVGFVARPLDKAACAKLKALESDIDTFHTKDREIYWRCGRRQSDSAFSNAVFEKVVGVRSTFRGIGTVKRMAAKYGQE